MQNPIVQFPFVNHTPNGAIVYSGIMPQENGRWTTIAFSPNADGAHIRTTQYVSFATFEEALDAAQNMRWYQTVKAV